MKYVDPSGHFLDTIYDLLSTGYDIYQLAKDPTWENAAYVAADVLAVAIPAVPSAAVRASRAGTKVKTDQGEKNIEELKIGDKVLAKDENTDEVTYKQVTATFNHDTDEIYIIHVGDQVIESTYNHPFWVVGEGWVFVKDLKPGDLLEQSDGKTLEVRTIELQQRQTTVYNMTVEGFHTYFVSGLGIWVHNDECRVISSRFADSPVANQVQDLSDNLYNRWNKGSFDTPGDALISHYNSHSEEVGATNLNQYVQKADGFAQNLRRAKTYTNPEGFTPGAVKYVKNGKYVILAPDKTILSFGGVRN